MANQIIQTGSITIDSRGSLILPFKVKDANGTQINISAWTLYLEVDGVPIREALSSDPADALGRRIMLNRTDVESLKESDLPFRVVNETDAEYPVVIWKGKIKRDGTSGAPDTDGAQ